MAGGVLLPHAFLGGWPQDMGHNARWATTIGAGYILHHFR